MNTKEISTMTRLKATALILTAMFVMTSGLGALAQPSAKPQPPMQQLERRPTLAQELKLSPEQQNKIKAIRDNASKEAEPLRQQLMAKQKEVMSYVGRPDATETKAIALQRDLHALQLKMAEHRLRTWFKIKSVMTPEQSRQYAEVRKQRMNQRGPVRKGAMGSPGDQPPGEHPNAVVPEQSIDGAPANLGY
jgi:Spy/CpxP family protein refolding chaperone